MQRCRLLFLSVRHNQTDELAEASVALMRRDACPTGFFLISISTSVCMF
jgi:hypothetical protein